MSKTEPHDAEGGALAKVGERVSSTLAVARTAAEDAASSTATEIQSNPALALLGGLAIGVIAGTMIPRSSGERDLLAPIGQRIGGAGRAALDAAKTTAGERLDEAGVNSENLRQQLGKLFEQLLKAAGDAGSAAVTAARDNKSR